MSARDIWPEVRIGEALRLINGYAFKPSDWSRDGGLPIVRIQNLNRADAPFNYYKGVLPLKVRLSGGELLFAWSGTPGTSFGAHIWSGGDAWLNQHIFKVEFDPKQFDLRFLRYAINRNLQEYIAAAHGGAGLAHITKGKFEASALPLPPLDEQRRIVAEIEEQLSRLEDGVAALKRVEANLKRYRASVLSAAILGELNGSAGTDGWTQTEIRALAARESNSITDGPFGSKLKTAHYTSTGPRVIRLQNIGDGFFVDEKAHISEDHFASLSKHRVFPNDLVIAGLGETLPRACLIPDDIGPAIVKADCIRFKAGSSVLPKFLMYALNADQTRRATKERMHGVGRPRLNLGEIKSIIVPVPPLARQQEIVEEVDRRFSVVEELETQVRADLARADRLRQAILSSAFSSHSEH